jgi:phage shock protein PspC (stress-responsive transcriptional regulator)
MQKVITSNLNGNAYQIDEGGYAALVAYLDGAARQLANNPDRAEIVADLEQAIADKCRGFLGPHKTVVSAAEVERIIRDMGPVDGAAGTSAPAGSAEAAAETKRESAGAARPPRRLYRIREGAMWEGVCTGLAAYAGIHVVFVRIAMVVLIVWSAGFGLLVYWILASSIPEAQTADERAAAHGQLPFNAQELIDRAKENYSSFTGRDARRRRRAEHRAWRRGWAPVPPSAADGYPSSALGGVRAVLLTVVFTMLAWFWAWTLFSLVTRGQVFGQTWPDDLPPWMGIVALVVLFQLVTWPLRLARHRTYYAPGGYYYRPMAALGGVMSLAFWVLAAWLAYHYIPEVREIIRALPDIARSFGI